MPRIFRAMLSDGERPEIGPTKKTLGVVPGDGENDDIPVDLNAMVSPRTGGMSVAPSWEKLPAFLIPKRFKDRGCEKAAGNNKLRIWGMGDGPFEESMVSETLRLVPDRKDHGTVQPAQSMSLVEYQAALAATADNWNDIEN